MLSHEELATNQETQKHIDMVRKVLFRICAELYCRGIDHDRSKLERPETTGFANITEGLKNLTYGSLEYREILRSERPTVQHHYDNNSHHPEHFDDGINGMNLIDLIEMVCDWKAASLRHEDGDFRKSIEINSDRFNMSGQLTQILLNTVDFFEEAAR